MEDFIVYSEIGHSQHSRSVTYRGRRAGTVVYVAIQSQPSQSEAHCKYAAAARCGPHPAICHVYKWCNTGHENWVVTDLCAGGNLQTLLQLDGPLSLNYLRSLLPPIFSAVMRAHSRGLIVGDLRPTKFLVDDGHLRLGSLSRALSFTMPAPPTTASSQNPHQRASTPDQVPVISRQRVAALVRLMEQRDAAYISPEVARGGPLTPAADMWSLGCLIWTMLRVGRSSSHSGNKLGPFSDFEPLSSDWDSDVTATRVLLRGLLEPEPTKRWTWQQIVSHPWCADMLELEESLDAAATFTQLAFAAEVPNESILTRTSTANSMDSSGTIQAPEDSDAETIDHGAHPDTSGGLSAPNEVSRDSAWAATPTLEVTLPGSVTASLLHLDERLLGTLRLSQSFSSSVNRSRVRSEASHQKRTPADQHRGQTHLQLPATAAVAPPPAAASAAAVAGQSRIPRSVPLDLPEKTPPSSAMTNNRSAAAFRAASATQGAQGNASIPPEPQESKAAAALRLEDKQSLDLVPVNRQADRPPPTIQILKSTGELAELAGQPPTSGIRAVEEQSHHQVPDKAAALVRASLTLTPGQLSNMLSDVSGDLTPGAGVGLITTLVQQLQESELANPVDSLLVTEADLVLQPVLVNKFSQPLAYDAAALGFVAMPAAQLLQLPPAEQAAYLQQLERALLLSRTGSGGSRSKSAAARASHRSMSTPELRRQGQVLGYISSLVCTSDQAANLIANSPIFPSLAASIKSFPSMYRERLAHVLANVLRTATGIDASVTLGSILQHLAEGVRDLIREVPAKRLLQAALGEGLFYVATQAANGSLPSHWNIPGVCLQITLRCLRLDEDVEVQLYAARTLENLVSVAGPHVAELCRNDVILQLWALYSHSKQAPTRRACLSTIFHLSVAEPALFQHLLDQAKLGPVAATIRDPSAVVRQAGLSCLLIPFSEVHPIPRAAAAIMESKDLPSWLLNAIKAGPLVCRGKAYLLLACIGSVPVRDGTPASLQDAATAALATAFQLRLGLELDRDDTTLGQDSMANIEQQTDLNYCLLAAAHLTLVCARALPIVLYRLIQALEPLRGRQHPPAAQAKTAREALAHADVCLELLNTAAVRRQVTVDALVSQLVGLLRFAGEVSRGSTNLADVSPAASTQLFALCFGLLDNLLQHHTFALHADVHKSQQPILRHHHLRMLWEALLPWLDAAPESAAGFRSGEQPELMAWKSLAAILDHHSILPEGPGQLSLQAWLDEVVVRLSRALTADDPWPALAARIARRLTHLDSNAEQQLQQQGLPTLALHAFQAITTSESARDQVRLADDTGNLPPAPPIGLADAEAVTWLASKAVRQPSADLLQLCQQFALTSKITSALRAIALTREEVQQHLLLGMAQAVADYTTNLVRSESSQQATRHSMKKYSSVLLHCLPALSSLTVAPDQELAKSATRVIQSLVSLFPQHVHLLFQSECLDSLSVALATQTLTVVEALLQTLMLAVTQQPTVRNLLIKHADMLGALHNLADIAVGAEGADLSQLRQLARNLLS